jgi:hypothetical protein
LRDYNLHSKYMFSIILDFMTTDQGIGASQLLISSFIVVQSYKSNLIDHFPSPQQE